MTAKSGMARVRFGIIGCGGAAPPVCEAIAASPFAALGRVYDIDLEAARTLGAQFDVPYTTRLDELLNDAALDAVYVAVPHHLLAPLARQALQAGKHVLVEKPMALSVREIDALIALADARTLTLGVFYQLRYASGLVQARKLIRTGALGQVVGVRMQTLIDKPPTYWQRGYNGRSRNGWRAQRARAGGGVVLMNTSHLLDALWYVTGLNVTRVAAECTTGVAGVEVEDAAVATLYFDNGAIGSLYAGAHIAGAHTGDECFELYGTQGTLRVPDPYGSDPLQVFLRNGYGEMATGVWHTLPVTPRNVYGCAIGAFAAAAQAHQPAPVNGRDARRVLEIVLALYRAAEEHQVVKIEEKHEKD